MGTKSLDARYSTQAVKPCQAKHLYMEIRRARPDTGPDWNNRCTCCTRTSLEPSSVQNWGLWNTGWQVWRLGEINFEAAASTQDFVKKEENIRKTRIELEETIYWYLMSPACKSRSQETAHQPARAPCCSRENSRTSENWNAIDESKHRNTTMAATVRLSCREFLSRWRAKNSTSLSGGVTEDIHSGVGWDGDTCRWKKIPCSILSSGLSFSDRDVRKFLTLQWHFSYIQLITIFNPQTLKMAAKGCEEVRSPNVGRPGWLLCWSPGSLAKKCLICRESN